MRNVMLMNVMEIVELKQGELDLCKQLRLNALEDAPNSFSETFDEARCKPYEYWQHIYESLIHPSRNRMFIAKDTNKNYGSVYALLDEKDNDTGRLGGMWVDSNDRKAGIGVALFNAVRIWAYEQKFTKIKLWVEDTDEGAKMFYKKLGFKETGLLDLSRSKINKDLCEMCYKLDA